MFYFRIDIIGAPRSVGSTSVAVTPRDGGGGEVRLPRLMCDYEDGCVLLPFSTARALGLWKTEPEGDPIGRVIWRRR
jgi:hypothetical protein